MDRPAGEEARKTCGNCGESIPLEAAWCPECGKRLEPIVEEPPVAQSAAQAVVPSGRKTEPSSGPMSEAMNADGKPSDAEKPKPLPAGTIIDKKYSILRVLGEGGMGIVYLAEDVHTGVEIVLKAVRPDLAHRK